MLRSCRGSTCQLRLIHRLGHQTVWGEYQEDFGSLFEYEPTGPVVLETHGLCVETQRLWCTAPTVHKFTDSMIHRFTALVHCSTGAPLPSRVHRLTDSLIYRFDDTAASQTSTYIALF